MSKIKLRARALEEIWAEKGSETFDSRNYANLHKARRQYLAESIVNTNPTSVLEIGCFGGHNLEEIHEMNPDIKLTGFDINKDALHFLNKTKSHLKINTVCGSAYELKDHFSDKQFDVVFTSGVLIHIPCGTLDSDFPEKYTVYGDRGKQDLFLQDISLVEDVCKSILAISQNYIFHGEHHGEKFENIKGTQQRYIHNFHDLYKEESVVIEKAFNASNGFEHLIKVTCR